MNASTPKASPGLGANHMNRIPLQTTTSADVPVRPVSRGLADMSVERELDSLQLMGAENPRNWRPQKKWIATLIVILMTATIAFCSSIYTAAILAIANDYGVSREVSTLGVSTFLLGFASGPLIFAPLSEVVGRNKVYQATFLLFVFTQLACALAPNIAALLVFRFLSGFFGSPTVTNSAASLADIWPPSRRSVPFALFSAASFLGPVLAPVVGGFLTQYTTWRWNFWLLLISSSVVYLTMVFFLPETYAPQLLHEKQRTISTEHVRYDLLLTQWRVSLTRPWVMLFTEPIVFSLSLYMAFVYGILYLDFTAYPIVFTTTRHWSEGISGLSFLGIGAGMAIATIASPLINKVHSRAVRKLGPVPEARLPHLIILAWAIPIGLFWFAWTALPPTHWIVAILAGVPFGLGLVPVFLGITAYLADCYGKYSASALAANAVLRSVFGAVFPLFARQMYELLGTPWATSLLGFIAATLAPLPWLFYKFGPRLRAISKYHTKTMEEELAEVRGSPASMSSA